MTVLNLEEEFSELEMPDLPKSGDEDSLSHYIRKVNHYKILTLGEEQALTTRWFKHQDEKAAHTLLTAHLKLVVKIASQYKGYGLPVEDLIAEGSLGLLKSLKNFKPEMGNRFSTYAMWWIKAEIKEYVLHNWSLVKMGTTRSQKRLFFSLRRSKRKLQDQQESFSTITDSNIKEIAGELMVSAEEVKSMNMRMGNRDFSLNATFNDSEGEETEWQDLLADDTPTHEEICIEADELSKRKARLEKAMSALSERESQILHHRRLVDEPATLDDLGKRYGLSRERIRQIETTAFEKLQTAILRQTPSQI